MLYTDASYNYYKVAVADGTPLMAGTVPHTCQEAGMEAVCPGPADCSTSSSRCIVTSLSTECYYHMRPISVQICDNEDPRECPELQGMFSYMNNFNSYGECGIVGDEWCAHGRDYVSGDPVYFAYCAAEK